MVTCFETTAVHFCLIIFITNMCFRHVARRNASPSIIQLEQHLINNKESINPLTAELFIWNFHPLEVVTRQQIIQSC